MGVKVRSGSPYEDRYGFSRAVRVADRILVSGTAPVVADGACPPDAYSQTQRCIEIVSSALGEAGASTGDVVRWRAYITDPSDADEVGRALGEAFGEARPAATMVVVAALLDPQWKVEIEAEAIWTP